ncbi:MAG: putative glycolipid-binding domain-containing protein [Ktedonobacterales bacterium]
MFAALVRFPSLEIRLLGQTYTRLDERTYRYESDTGFRAEIVVDEVGFVVTYPGGWDRLLPTT